MQKAPSQKEINIFLEHYKSKRYIEAEKLAYTFTKEFPKYSFGWKALGVVLKKTGKLSNFSCKSKSLQINPKMQKYTNLANF